MEETSASLEGYWEEGRRKGRMIGLAIRLKSRVGVGRRWLCGRAVAGGDQESSSGSSVCRLGLDLLESGPVIDGPANTPKPKKIL